MTIKTRNIADAAVTAVKLADGTLTDSTALAAGIVAASKLDATATGGISNTTDGLLALRVARVTFDATNVAGNRTQAAHAPGPVTIPAKGWVCGGFFEVIAQFTSGTNVATVAISVEGANDIQTAAAVSGAPYSTTGLKAIVPKANTPESTGVQASVARDITFTVAGGEDLTAGILVLFLFYVVSV